MCLIAYIQFFVWGPDHISRFFIIWLLVPLAATLHYAVEEWDYLGWVFRANAYVALIHVMALLNGQEGILLALVDSVLVFHLHGVSHSVYYYQNAWGLCWLWTTSTLAMGFWMSVLYTFVEQRRIQRIIPTFPTGNVPTVHSPGRSLLPPPRQKKTK